MVGEYKRIKVSGGILVVLTAFGVGRLTTLDEKNEFYRSSEREAVVSYGDFNSDGIGDIVDPMGFSGILSFYGKHDFVSEELSEKRNKEVAEIAYQELLGEITRVEDIARLGGSE